MKNILIALLLLPIVLSAQNNKEKKDELLKHFNKIRKEKTKNEIREDTLISNAIFELIENADFIENADKTQIRKTLRKNGVYDYNVELISFKIKDIESVDTAEIKNKSRKLNSLLQDSTYNIIGAYLTKKNGNFKVDLIFLQRYLSIGTGFVGMPCDMIREDPGTCWELVVSGLKYNDDIFYEVIENESDIGNKRIGKKLEKGNLKVYNYKDKENVFRSRFEKGVGDIVFYNSKGKILSYISNSNKQ